MHYLGIKKRRLKPSLNYYKSMRYVFYRFSGGTRFSSLAFHMRSYT